MGEEGKIEGENRGCFYLFPFSFCFYLYNFRPHSSTLNRRKFFEKIERTVRETRVSIINGWRKIWFQKENRTKMRKTGAIVTLNRFPPSLEEKTTTTRINFYKVLRKLNDTANSPLSWVVALFYNRTLLEELRTFSKTRQRTLQLKEADTLPDNGPINLSWNF